MSADVLDQVLELFEPSSSCPNCGGRIIDIELCPTCGQDPTLAPERRKDYVSSK